MFVSLQPLQLLVALTVPSIASGTLMSSGAELDQSAGEKAS